MAGVFRGFVPMLALVAGLTCMPVAAQAAFPGANGRVYTVAFHATDERGATCAGETAVTVPRHRN